MYRHFLKSEDCLARCHLLGIVTSFVRCLCVVTPFFVISYLVTIPPMLPTMTRSLLMTISISVGCANGLYLFFKKSKIIYIAVGVLCGLASVVL
jgi:ABC-type sulfate transport system permease component